MSMMYRHELEVECIHWVLTCLNRWWTCGVSCVLDGPMERLGGKVSGSKKYVFWL